MSITPTTDHRNAGALDPISAAFLSAVEKAFASKIAPHLRSDDEYLPLDEAAQFAGIRGKDPARVLRDAGKRGELRIGHAGKAPVVQRGELHRWISARPLTVVKKTDDARAEARASIAAAAARTGASK